MASLILGLDVGGTKTAGCACVDAAGPIYRWEGPGANLQRQGLPATVAVLQEAIATAQRRFPGASLAALCIGVAGAGREDDQVALRSALAEALGAAAPSNLWVLSDAGLALEAAFPAASGLIVIAGTGSIVLARTEDGAVLRAGGWGPRLGDPGSGTALGMAALRATADAFDGGPPTLLQAWLRERYAIASPADLIRAVYDETLPPQHLAPLVAEAAAQDAVAATLLRHAAGDLAERAVWLCARATAIRPQMALLGGLMRSAPYRRALEQALRRRLPGWTVVEATQAPEEAALHLALRRAAGRSPT